MANGGNRTIVVAVAGIAATALVGLVGTTTAWLSARDDRDEQRALARDERTYDRRAAVYLDAIDFLEGQRASLNELFLQDVSPRPGVPLPASTARLRLRIPYEIRPPTRLTTRLRAFGSDQAFTAFQKTQAINGGGEFSMPAASPKDFLPFVPSKTSRGFGYLDRGRLGSSWEPSKRLVGHWLTVPRNIDLFEDIVHDELGF